jgi:hypothetical protein
MEHCECDECLLQKRGWIIDEYGQRYYTLPYMEYLVERKRLQCRKRA